MTEHAHDGFVDWMRAIHPWGVLLGVLVGCLRHGLGFGLFLCVVSFGCLPLRWVVRWSDDVDALGPLDGIGALLRVRPGANADRVR